MLRTADSRILRVLSGFVLLAATGCNDAGSSPERTDADGGRQGSLPLMSVGEVSNRPVTDFTSSEPTLAEPTDAVPPQGEPGNPGPTPAAGNAEHVMTRAEADLAQALKLWDTCQDASTDEAVRRDNLNQVIDRAARAMALTRGQAEQADVFNMAAVTRANARVQLTLIADTTAINEDAEATEITEADILAQEADELFRYDATSMAATETAYRVVELARELAERHADEADSVWTQSYARQSRLFGQRFPQEGHRAPISLAMAGEMCERTGLMDEACQCYTMLTTTFADSLASIEAERALNRINLDGPLVDFAGETLDGDWLDLAELEGHAVIVFFKSGSPEFLAQLEELKGWKHVQIVGVNLDTDEAIVRDFVESQGFPGTVLFPSDPQLRGENHPLATHYAVRSVPSYWLIDLDGRVAGTSVDFEDLRVLMLGLFSQ